MQNVSYTVENSVLTIHVDLTQTLGLSKSGKTQVVGTTSGFEYLDEQGHAGVMFSLNVNRKV